MSERKSILCPNCRKLISKDESVCPYCGLVSPGLHDTAGKIRNIFGGSDPVMTIIYINIAFYILSLIWGGIATEGFNFLSPSNISLFTWEQAAPTPSWESIVTGR